MPSGLADNCKVSSFLLSKSEQLGGPHRDHFGLARGALWSSRRGADRSGRQTGVRRPASGERARLSPQAGGGGWGGESIFN